MRLALLILAFLTAFSCTHSPATRYPAKQYDALVKLVVTCPGGGRGAGTGVLVAPDVILTAQHVVTCMPLPPYPLYVAPEKIEVFFTDTESTEGTVEVELSQHDVARVKLATGAPQYFSPISIGPKPGIGDRVCEVSAVPRTTYRCGVVQPETGPYIGLDFMVEHGNSGSALYNSAGQLVGIVVQLVYCENQEICAGRAIPLEDYPWLVP